MLKRRGCISIGLLVFLGLVMGVASALVWYFGTIYGLYTLLLREMLPYALVFSAVLFFVTAILRLKCGYSFTPMHDECCKKHACMSVCKYSPIILITAAVFILVALIVLRTFFSFTVRAILAFIGAISFWTMLVSFLAMLFCSPCWHRR